MGVTLMVGTDRAAYLYRSADRGAWTIEGPLFKGWKVTAATRDGQGRYWAATASQVYGAAIHVSDDLKNWRQIENGPTWPKQSDRKLNQIWTLVASSDRLYAGVDEAGLFVSDNGESWEPVGGLNEHATRPSWFPGAGGLCAHVILVDPTDEDRIWIGISAVGVFRSDDGGKTFHPKNNGVKIIIEDEEDKQIGYCVHGMVADPDDPNTIYRREHTGMFRTRDGGESWDRIEEGLPGWFGFPITMDRSRKTIYVIPLESDEYRIPVDGKLKVYRSGDGGEHWEPTHHGLPQEHAYMGVLRGAMDADQLDPCGIYFGTTAGTVYTTRDSGDSWQQLPGTLPRVLSVKSFVET